MKGPYNVDQVTDGAGAPELAGQSGGNMRREKPGQAVQRRQFSRPKPATLSIGQLEPQQSIRQIARLPDICANCLLDFFLRGKVRQLLLPRLFGDGDGDRNRN
jgi:hypothetical protein